MRVLRGREPTRETDREATATMLTEVARAGEPAVRVWAPHRHVAFGRRDARGDGYEAARLTAERQGFPAVERSVGGRAVAYTGTTLAFAVAVPLADARSGLAERYATATRTVLSTLDELGTDVERGEPPAAYCPGTHSVRAVRGGKVAGIAQRVRTDAALVAGCLVVSESDERDIADVLRPVYDELDVPFDPASVGSVASAGGPDDPYRVVRAVETAFVEGPWGDGDRRVQSLGEPRFDGG